MHQCLSAIHLGDFGCVVHTTQMRQHDAPHRCIHVPRDEDRQGFVRQMTARTGYALFNRRSIRPYAKQLDGVIRFDDECHAALAPLDEVVCCFPNIGCNHYDTLWRSDPEGQCLDGIVGNTERIDAEPAERITPSGG